MPNYGHLSLSCTKIERPSPLEKPSCKVRLFANRHSRKYRQKVTATTLSPTASHPDFQLLAQTAHVRFHGRKRVHARLCQQDRTQRPTRRNRGPSSLQTQHSFVLPAKSSPKEQPEEADARLWRVSASSGVAAPLGCVILSLVFQHCVLLLSMWNSHTTQTDWYRHSRLVLHAVEPPTSGHRNGPLIVYCSVWQILY